MIETRTLPGLDAAQRSQIVALAAGVEALDGAEPLNEAALLRLSSEADQFRHLLATNAGTLSGYAQLDRRDPTAPTAEVLVGPARRSEVADALLSAAEVAGGPPLLVWARGHSPVGPAAEQRGYREQRVMLVMSRDLAGAQDVAVDVPDGIRLRTFGVGTDEAAWLAVNARAFAGHPEQGGWASADLAARMAQDWFDPSGFLLAEDDEGRLLGYHWTKVHSGPEPVAEVYVLGIDPDGQGRGLGRALLAAGLRHLAASKAERVILYLEEANAAALHLYLDAGFAVTRRDVRLLGPLS